MTFGEEEVFALSHSARSSTNSWIILTLLLEVAMISAPVILAAAPASNCLILLALCHTAVPGKLSGELNMN